MLFQKDGVFMKRRELVVVLLCMLILSNIATYRFTRFFFSSPALEVSRERDEAGLFWEVWDILEKKYFQPVEEERMIQGAIKGMLQSLDDPHTSYLSPESMEDMLIHTTGSLSGIGVEIVEDEGEILILRVIENSPAQQVGLIRGDCIVEVKGKSMDGVKLDEAARLLRGPSGTTVKIVVRRAGEEDPLQLTITRAKIEMGTVFAQVLEKGVGYIRITNFDQGTGKDFSESLTFLEKQGLKGLVLDLRDNAGGLLDEAVAVGEVIVPSGEITRVVDREGNVQERYFSQAKPKDYKIVVLINEYTASAAEIIAGALQDSGKALLVGMPTFGKATVQYLQFLSDGGGLRYTIAKYLTPGGHDLHKHGLQPDFEVNLPPEYYLQYRTVPRNLEQGDSGERVILLQNMLSFLGYPVEITGVFDTTSGDYLKEFQRNHDLLPTGTLDISTREHLRSALSEKAGKVDEQLKFAVDILKG
ncbi:MAG: PDZ domain-containing protein [Dethiobacter sp.]|nr:MAG: PDZ domain-containing protein [Dethiobacter sp.]